MAVDEDWSLKSEAEISKTTETMKNERDPRERVRERDPMAIATHWEREREI